MFHTTKTTYVYFWRLFPGHIIALISLIWTLLDSCLIGNHTTSLHVILTTNLLLTCLTSNIRIIYCRPDFTFHQSLKFSCLNTPINKRNICNMIFMFLKPWSGTFDTKMIEKTMIWNISWNINRQSFVSVVSLAVIPQLF